MTDRRTFKDVEDASPAAAEHVLGPIRRNEVGYALTPYRINFHGQIQEFVQVDHPDGTTSYFTYDGDDPRGFRAGPFGGGYSWAVPKYVLAEVETLIDSYFAPSDEEVQA